MQNFRNSILAFAAASALAIPVQASAQAQPNPQVVTQFDAATISRLLLDVQATWQVETDAMAGRFIVRRQAPVLASRYPRARAAQSKVAWAC